MAGQVGIVGHVEIADGTVIAAQSGVSKSIPGGVWFGYPAVPIAEAKQQTLGSTVSGNFSRG